MYIYINIHVYIYTHVYIYVIINIHVYVYTHVYIYKHTHTHVYIYVMINIHVYIYTHTRIYIHKYIYTHTSWVCIYIYIYTLMIATSTMSYTHIWDTHIHLVESIDIPAHDSQEKSFRRIPNPHLQKVLKLGVFIYTYPYICRHTTAQRNSNRNPSWEYPTRTFK